jgi:hypothetical protein
MHEIQATRSLQGIIVYDSKKKKCTYSLLVKLDADDSNKHSRQDIGANNSNKDENHNSNIAKTMTMVALVVVSPSNEWVPFWEIFAAIDPDL